jgi:membrane associated rhomboid family serine protease
VQQRLTVVLLLVGAIWAVELVNWLLAHSLNHLGILPRTVHGLIGIVAAPFLHANPGHAASNTVPLLVLGWLVSLHGRARFLRVAIFVSLGTGLAVWLFARDAYHVGASGLVFGLFGYIVGRAWFERSLAAIISAVGAVLLYGGLVFGVFPERQVSFESHLFGLIMGITLARLDVGQRRR